MARKWELSDQFLVFLCEFILQNKIVDRLRLDFFICTSPIYIYRLSCFQASIVTNLSELLKSGAAER